MKERKHQAEFVRRGMVAIQDTQRTSAGIPAEQLIDQLEAKLKTARQAKAWRG